MSLTRYEKEKKLILLREKRIRLSKVSFWEFCKTLHPDFYKKHYHHLKDLCTTLQKLVQGELTNEDLEVLLRLFIIYPPQHGKSRTLILFCAWCLGVDPNNKMLTVSYNEATATDFSKYTRDEISREKNQEFEIVYSDIFPNTRVKRGSASYRKWAIENQHFSYLGCGIGGSLTSKGFTIRVIDDPYKNEKDVNSPLYRSQVIKFYTGTFLSRRAGGKVIDIICHTRWHEDDLIGYVKRGPNAKKWAEIYKPAIDKNGNMLCSEMLSREDFADLEKEMDPLILSANYKGIALSSGNKLYNLKTYFDIPRKPDNSPAFERIIAYTDTADKGEDYLCSIVAGQYQGFLYILGVVCTQLGQEVTVSQVASLIKSHNVNYSKTESNNGGKSFSDNVEKEVRSKGNIKTKFEWYHQSENKEARILTNAYIVNNIVLVPHDWQITMTSFYTLISEYQRTYLANKFHDAADAITGLVEILNLFQSDPKGLKSLVKRDTYNDLFS